MPYSFNVIDQPWIPVLVPDDPVPRMVSLREAIMRAHEIRAISDPSPLVTISLHRLLLAVVHRCFGPADAQAWATLWAQPSFDPSVINAYLDKWHDRFDLFDAERPFYQTAGLPRELAVPVSKLTFAKSSGNNALLFDHSRDAEPEAIPADEAARLLVAYQAFSIGGLITKLPGEPTGSDSSHLVKGAVVLPRGDNLFQTLMLSVVQLDGDLDAPFAFDPRTDMPAWERDTPTPRETATDFGYLELLTWQNRRVLLFPEEAPDGQVVVRFADVLAGRAISKDLDIRRRETMVAYRLLAKPAKNQDPWAPIGFKPEKALWRGSLALVQSDDRHQPKTLTWLTGLFQQGFEYDRLHLSVYGLSSDRANVFLWRSDHMDLPTAYLQDAELVAELAMGLQAAEDVGRILKNSTGRLAAKVLEPDGNPDRGRVDALISALAPERTYWPALDIPFRQHILTLPGDTAANETLADHIQHAAEAAWESACNAVATNGRGFQAVAESSPVFYRLLRQAVQRLRPSEPSADTNAIPQEVPA
ncbi:type I-E CRISPR-associated protein Cse1/CasA [bacterium]|nr:type I-E CRISPR-associated protein Cse1/CasA [bacterium]